MFQYSNNKTVNYGINKIYSTIVDVERYPEFIPWCSGARIISVEENFLIADLIISFKGINLKYTSEVYIENEIDQSGEAIVRTKMAKGPFKFLESKWKLKKINEKTTNINFDIKFLLKSIFLEKILSPFFKNACSKILNSFNDHLKKSI